MTVLIQSSAQRDHRARGDVVALAAMPDREQIAGSRLTAPDRPRPCPVSGLLSLSCRRGRARGDTKREGDGVLPRSLRLSR
jgi:hypothetical protein